MKGDPVPVQRSFRSLAIVGLLSIVPTLSVAHLKLDRPVGGPQPSASPRSGKLAGYGAQKALAGNTLFQQDENYSMHFKGAPHYKIELFDVGKGSKTEFDWRLFPDKPYFGPIGTQNVIYYAIEIDGDRALLTDIKKETSVTCKLLPGNPKNL